jgi:transcriptional regulator of acetoin/glycerol metabolism
VVPHLDELPPALVAATASLLEAPQAQLIGTTTGECPDLAVVVERFAVVLDVPPLRARTAELPALLAEIIANLHPEHPRPRCTPEAMAALGGGEWPGNLRQLRQVVATALAHSSSGDITVEDLPDELTVPRQRRLTKLERLERQALMAALRDAAWDREAAAHDLGISRATVYRKLKRFGIPASA